MIPFVFLPPPASTSAVLLFELVETGVHAFMVAVLLGGCLFAFGKYHGPNLRQKTARATISLECTNLVTCFTLPAFLLLGAIGFFMSVAFFFVVQFVVLYFLLYEQTRTSERAVALYGLVTIPGALLASVLLATAIFPGLFRLPI